MKSYLIIIFGGILLYGCNVTKNINFSGHYVSYCRNLGFPELVADFNKDSTFLYKHSHSPNVISGKWEVKNDTLFLFSKIFEIKTEYNGQYTEKDNVDVYLIRGKYLYRFTKTGFTKDCPLIRVKK